MPSRPAESGGVGAAVALVIAYLLGLHDPALVTALGVVVGFVPAAITWLVTTLRGDTAPHREIAAANEQLATSSHASRTRHRKPPVKP